MGIESEEAFGFVGVWQTTAWAQSWFEDAVRECKAIPASRTAGRQARRREIVSAVCFLESYIFEWIRDAVLPADPVALAEYFPSGSRSSVSEKWRKLPKRLYKDGKLAATPDFGGPHGQDFQTLIDYRDGLVHASASRPSTHPQAEADRPVPAVEVLDKLQPGWAIGVAVERVRRLHAAAGTPTPAWLATP